MEAQSFTEAYIVTDVLRKWPKSVYPNNVSPFTTITIRHKRAARYIHCNGMHAAS